MKSVLSMGSPDEYAEYPRLYRVDHDFEIYFHDA